MLTGQIQVVVVVVVVIAHTSKKEKRHSFFWTYARKISCRISGIRQVEEPEGMGK